MKIVPAGAIFPGPVRSALRNPTQHLADRTEGRYIRRYVQYIRAFYRLSKARRCSAELDLLKKTIQRASRTAFYRDRFSSDIYEKLDKSIMYIQDTRITTKDDVLNDPLAFLAPDRDPDS